MKKRGRESFRPARKAKTNSTNAGSPHSGSLRKPITLILGVKNANRQKITGMPTADSTLTAIGNGCSKCL